jgi:hypothetical protein
LPDPSLLLHYLAARLRLDPGVHRRNERGMTTTEVAVITFLLVGAAIVVLGIIYAAARNNANSIPTPEAPSGS